MMIITNVYSKDPAKNGISSEGVKIEGKKLYCKTSQSIRLGTIKVSGTDGDASAIPNLIIKSDRSDKDIALSEINLKSEDGLLKNINVTILTQKVGTTTVTIDVNGTKTSFDVVVTE